LSPADGGATTEKNNETHDCIKFRGFFI